MVLGIYFACTTIKFLWYSPFESRVHCALLPKSYNTRSENYIFLESDEFEICGITHVKVEFIAI